MNTEDDSISFQDANWIIQKRNAKLGDILADSRIEWLAVLLDGYLDISGRYVEVRSFDELELLRQEFDLLPLIDIRSQGLLIEGNRALPMELVNLLAECSGGLVRVRTSSNDLVESIDANKFTIVMSASCCEDELEVSSVNGAWYLRMRDDDALMFIAASHIVAGQIKASFPAHVRSVSTDFLFAA